MHLFIYILFIHHNLSINFHSLLFIHYLFTIVSSPVHSPLSLHLSIHYCLLTIVYSPLSIHHCLFIVHSLLFNHCLIHQALSTAECKKFFSWWTPVACNTPEISCTIENPFYDFTPLYPIDGFWETSGSHRYVRVS